MVFSEYILGERVAGLEIKFDGIVIATPPWSTVLSYEKELRIAAMDLVTDGEQPTMAAALKAVCRDPHLKQIYFMEPITLKQEKAPETTLAVPSWSRPTLATPGFAPRFKGGKAGSKGGKSAIKGTPDGRMICYAFNNGENLRRRMQHDPRLTQV